MGCAPDATTNVGLHSNGPNGDVNDRDSLALDELGGLFVHYAAHSSLPEPWCFATEIGRAFYRSDNN
jgi:hypothetical protein